MTNRSLTDEQRRLLQRWFDGELAGGEHRRAEELIDSSNAAAEYVERLEEVRTAAGIAIAEVEAIGRNGLSTEQLVAAAHEAPPLTEEAIDELAPLLERYHDGETTPAETRSVEQLRAERNDVRDFLEGLEFLGDSTRAAGREVAEGANLDRIWEGVDRDIRFESPDRKAPSYRPERDQRLLHRYADGELGGERRNLVEHWLETDDEARATLEAIETLGEAARGASHEARDGVELDGIWEGVEERLDEETAGAGESGNVVSIDRGRRTGDESPEEAESTEADSASQAASGGVVEWIGDYRQGAVGAAAAAAVLLAAAALFGPRLFEKERVVVKEKETVVIVDSVEYGAGSTVAVDGPMKEVGSKPEPDDGAEKEDKPTVIWLLDSNGDDEGGADERDEDDAEPATSPGNGGSDDGPSSSEEDAGSSDGADGTDGEGDDDKPGQPI